VRWRGFVDNARDWMAAAACVVVPSVWQEPYGMVAAEAVALGRRVVASDVGGLPEACGGKAVLVPPGDAGALAAAIEKMTDDGNRQQSIAIDCNRGGRRAE
jgi:glycosyltransferase involved in cell wall biosynthesis